LKKYKKLTGLQWPRYAIGYTKRSKTCCYQLASPTIVTRKILTLTKKEKRNKISGGIKKLWLSVNIFKYNKFWGLFQLYG
jgi:hypothetical protein